jgi:hypothetical protein
MSILTSLTLPLAALTAFSRTGVSCLQGPHQGAQHRLVLRFLDHVLDEALRGRVLDRAVGSRRYYSVVLQHISPLFQARRPGSITD